MLHRHVLGIKNDEGLFTLSTRDHILDVLILLINLLENIVLLLFLLLNHLFLLLRDLISILELFVCAV